MTNLNARTDLEVTVKEIFGVRVELLVILDLGWGEEVKERIVQDFLLDGSD